MNKSQEMLLLFEATDIKKEGKILLDLAMKRAEKRGQGEEEDVEINAPRVAIKRLKWYSDLNPKIKEELKDLTLRPKDFVAVSIDDTATIVGTIDGVWYFLAPEVAKKLKSTNAKAAWKEVCARNISC